MKAQEQEETKTEGLQFPEQINIVSGYGKAKVRFYLRMITVAEENQYMQRFVHLPDDPEAKRLEEYGVLLDGLKQWSVSPPTVVERDKKEVPLVEHADAAEALDQYFKDITPAKERLLNSVLLMFRNGMAPDTDFF